MGCHTYRIHTLIGSVITTSESENIQAVLATKFYDFDLGPQRKEMFFEVLGNGIFIAEGKEWAHYRHMIKPQFTRV
jgi:cytochrome P450